MISGMISKHTCRPRRVKKNLNAAKPPEQSKGLGGIRTLAVRTKKLYMILKRFSNVITKGQHNNFGEKPTVILHTDISDHVGTPKLNTKEHYHQVLI